MRRIHRAILAVPLMTLAAAQPQEPPLSDARLTVQTLVREDIFAGLFDDDLQRLARGERNIELLLQRRPGQRAESLAWKGIATLYRGVRGLENNRTDGFENELRRGLDLLAEARTLRPASVAVAAVAGGGYVFLADRLPEELRAQAWARAYDCYQVLWKQQAANLERLPLHLRGELLGGLAQSAQRTGRTKEVATYLDKILDVLPDTPYGLVAKKWKHDPAAAADTRITCLTCHAPGRLAARQTVLEDR